MPTVELVRDSMPDLLPMQGRSKGDHVSTLVNELCIELGHYEDDGGPGNQARLELGNCWEHALIHRLALDSPDKYMQPGEYELDGIFGTPDLIDPGECADHEIKCTFMSSKWGPGSEKFWKYETQLRSYLAMLGWWTVGYLHVCFVNGDYAWRRLAKNATQEQREAAWKDNGPQYRVWRYEYTQMELEANWRMLVKQAVRKQR